MDKRISYRWLMIVGIIVTLGLMLASCAAAATTAPPPTAVPVVIPTPVPAPTCAAPVPCPTPVAGPVVPNEKLWAASPHNAKTDVPFTDWDTTADKMVPAACSQCHTSTGYQAFLAAGKVDKPVPIGETIQCITCHSPAAENLTAVKFLSGIEIKNLGSEARCMVCHQGRATKKQIDEKIALFGATDLDKVVPPLKDGDKTTNFTFVNVHYFAAALTLYGSEAQGGYQYDGQSYDIKNQHVAGVDTCVSCHDPHTTEIRVEKCSECHTEVKTREDLVKIRTAGSTSDYNGNGDVKEGIAAEITGMQAALLQGIQAYAKDIAGMGIVYDGATYPYFLQDKGNTGKPDKDDKGNPVAYASWTPRMMKAAFNYQVSIKDPGAFAHNPKYIIELLYDSTADLNAGLTTKVDMSKLVRDDAGHFSGSGMPFRDWDGEGEVPAGCAKCHSAGGLPEFIHNGGALILDSKGTLNVTGITGQPVSNGLACTTCHIEAAGPTFIPVSSVPFPSGAMLTFSTEKDDKGVLKPVAANLCIECHQGRQSTQSVNAFLSAFPAADKVDAKITFKNVHYFAAGATLFGTDAKSMYEYTGKQYVGRNLHVENFNTCTGCHDKHALTVKAETCAGCHKVADPKKIRMTTANYDGNKDSTEPMSAVIETFQTRLLAGIQKYAKNTSKLGILYDAGSNPYFFVDKEGDGKADVDANGAAIRYNAFTPRLLKAAYNYQYSVKDPGGFAHNPLYILQGLYDSIQDIGGDVTGLVRPTVPPVKK